MILKIEKCMLSEVFYKYGEENCQVLARYGQELTVKINLL